MASFKVTFVNGSEKYIIPEGTSAVGRKNSIIPLKDLKLSRKQAEIIVNTTAGTVKLVTIGINPVSIWRNGDPFEEKLQTNQDCMLNDGDLVRFSIDTPKFSVYMSKDDIKDHNGNKRKRGNQKLRQDDDDWQGSEEEHDASEDDIELVESDDEKKPTAKRPRKQMKDEDEEDEWENSESEDDRVLCKYGKDCYRKNPDHLKEFRHPHLENQGGTKNEGLSKQRTTHQGSSHSAASSAEKTGKKSVQDSEPLRDDKPKNPESEIRASTKKRIKSKEDQQEGTLSIKKDEVESKSADQKSKKEDSKTQNAIMIDEEEEDTPSSPVLVQATPSSRHTISKPPASATLNLVSIDKTASSMDTSTRLLKNSGALLNNVPSSAHDIPTDDESAPVSPPKPLATVPPSSATKQPTPKPHESAAAKTPSHTKSKEDKSEPDDNAPGAYSLAFPSLATSANMFPLEEAIPIVLEAVTHVLDEIKDERLHLVLVESDSSVVSRFRSQMTPALLTDTRFSLLNGSLVTLKTTSNTPCRYIANETNWRFKAIGPCVDRLVRGAAGPSFETLMREKFGSALSADHVYPIVLPPESPLRSEQDVQIIISVIPPNMNPGRPDSLDGDYTLGREKLRRAYTLLFQSFLRISGLALQSATDLSSERESSTSVTPSRPPLVTSSSTARTSLSARTSVSSSPSLAKASSKPAPTASSSSVPDILITSSTSRIPSSLPPPQTANPPSFSSSATTSQPPSATPSSTAHATISLSDSDSENTAPVAVPDPSSSVRSTTSIPSESALSSEKPSTALEPLDTDADLPRYANPKLKVGGEWDEAIDEVARHPDKNAKNIFWRDKDVIVMYDAFPKARNHLMVIPADPITGFEGLKKEHLPLLEKIEQVGKWIARMLQEDDPGLTFRIGYHAIPSLKHLHMHIISQDFESDALKTKEHYNSFTSGFFIDSSELIKILREQGRVSFDENKYGAMKKQALKCFRCGIVPANMPKLKAHLLTCKK
mmetsp:Transcript_30582/g.49490  ORF Transcript_30582/g.49490 Transcript_30582/m.49490 type:complete len:997 (-) Transcript_30582:353-3343(-)|eukprot:CAMPEP_0184352188 /NCGR_PEP_ID=MMETSP1089-20130417/62036_1 /TAXON_ID=38269 ORGANISM="Gloeochaete wittrockiana, Strain SAG46.84" /NCGR_SAMPLE_ID=MMETSP1089 /ASSEMBLY_ACC=CAM_ASM_000445 /LENGTH=996 /DNA_ID=CAMNT_0026686399 /DNA_START=50 /DNA_END=3040 /DNA_ORIENTATION=+